MPVKKTHSDGDRGRADVREAKDLLLWCRANGVTPLALTVGAVKLELTVAPAPTMLAPPTAADAQSITAQYGGAALAALLEEVEDGAMGPH